MNSKASLVDIAPDVQQQFATHIIAWYQKHGRKTLPWQQNRTPYRVWVSEIMLQQTQVATVIDYYLRFMAAFPTVTDLASAAIDDVLKLWTGLGYYARARNLHRTAQLVVEQFAGEFPTDIETIQQLPGIGRSTGAAILSLALNQPEPILDGNVKRIFARCFMVVGWYGQAKVAKQLWSIAEQLSPQQQIQPYNQGLMDIGSAICTRSDPHCQKCPVLNNCMAYAQQKTAEFPHKKPKKAKPVRTQSWLIVQRGSAVFLRKRPPSGIWGGLYCFDTFEDEAALKTYCVERQIAMDDYQYLPAMTHTFTHFQLNIQPIVVTLANEQGVAEITDLEQQRWHNVYQQAEFGVPTPVIHLINQIKQ